MAYNKDIVAAMQNRSPSLQKSNVKQGSIDISQLQEQIQQKEQSRNFQVDRTQEANQKQHSGPKSKTSPYIGVSRYKRTGRWEAHIWEVQQGGNKTSKGKQSHLGSFTTAIEAARVYDRAAYLVRGSKAQLNFPESDYENDKLIQDLRNMDKHSLYFALRKASQSQTLLPQDWKVAELEQKLDQTQNNTQNTLSQPSQDIYQVNKSQMQQVNNRYVPSNLLQPETIKAEERPQIFQQVTAGQTNPQVIDNTENLQQYFSNLLNKTNLNSSQQINYQSQKTPIYQQPQQYSQAVQKQSHSGKQNQSEEQSIYSLLQRKNQPSNQYATTTQEKTSSDAQKTSMDTLLQATDQVQAQGLSKSKQRQRSQQPNPKLDQADFQQTTPQTQYQTSTLSNYQDTLKKIKLDLPGRTSSGQKEISQSAKSLWSTMQTQKNNPFSTCNIQTPAYKELQRSQQLEQCSALDTSPQQNKTISHLLQAYYNMQNQQPDQQQQQVKQIQQYSGSPVNFRNNMQQELNQGDSNFIQNMLQQNISILKRNQLEIVQSWFCNQQPFKQDDLLKMLYDICREQTCTQNQGQTFSQQASRKRSIQQLQGDIPQQQDKDGYFIAPILLGWALVKDKTQTPSQNVDQQQNQLSNSFYNSQHIQNELSTQLLKLSQQASQAQNNQNGVQPNSNLNMNRTHSCRQSEWANQNKYDLLKTF